MCVVCVEITLHVIKFGVKGKFVLMLYSSESRIDISRITIVVPCFRILALDLIFRFTPRRLLYLLKRQLDTDWLGDAVNVRANLEMVM